MSFYACQPQCASAFGLSRILAAAALGCDLAAHSRFTRAAASGRTNTCHVCRGCGCRIARTGFAAGLVNLTSGTLDDPSHLVPAGHIWTDRALAFVALAGLTDPRQPPNLDALAAAWRAPTGAPS